VVEEYTEGAEAVFFCRLRLAAGFGGGGAELTGWSAKIFSVMRIVNTGSCDEKDAGKNFCASAGNFRKPREIKGARLGTRGVRCALQVVGIFAEIATFAHRFWFITIVS
jgi:hypothetical protein